MEGIEGHVRHLAQGQAIHHGFPRRAFVKGQPHLPVGRAREHVVLVPRAARQGGHHPEAQPRFQALGQVVADRLPHPKRGVVHAVHALRCAPSREWVGRMEHHRRIPALPVFFFNALGPAVPLGLVVPLGETEGEVSVLHRGHPHVLVDRVIKGRESVSPSVAGPGFSHGGVAGGGAVVLGPSREPTGRLRDVGDVVKLADGHGLHVGPCFPMVVAAVRPAVGGQNQRLGPHPLQIVLVGVDFVRPPFGAHAFPRGSPVEAVPKLHPQHGDVVGIPWVDAHLGEVPTEPTEDALGHGPFRHQRRPGVAVVGAPVKVAELQVRAHRVHHKPAGVFLDADAAPRALPPGIVQQLPRVAAVGAAVKLVGFMDQFALGGRPNAVPGACQQRPSFAGNPNIIDAH